MGKNRSVRFDPWGIEVTTDREATLLELAKRADVGIEALCGGAGVCGTCTLHVENGMENLSAVSREEQSVLSESQLAKGYRLGCETRVMDGDVTVFVPPKSRIEQGVIMTEGRSMEFQRRPAARRYPLEIQSPTLEETLADRERLLSGLSSEYDVDISTVDRLGLCSLPNTMRSVSEADGTLHCTPVIFAETELLTVYPGRKEPIYGVAVDVGTTTLACYLANLDTGEICATTSRLNPQISHGGDIISRVEFAQRGQKERTSIHREIAEAVNEMIGEVAGEVDISRGEILDAVFVGNTAMHHLFLEIETKPVTVAPYIPGAHALLEYKAREVDIEINESAYCSWLPVIGGWVGPDFVADLLAANVFERQGTTVYIDIGTNGEIGVSTGDRLLAASAPAGPALEGAEITDGVQAKPGAIERVSVSNETWEPTITVIGETSPIGICGSGLLDAVAQLFEVGAISRRGRLCEPEENPKRIRDREDGEREFVLVEGKESDHGEEIVISQADIREIQHAKAAIQTGTNLLLDVADVETVDQLVMAGGFGNSIDPESAGLLGLFPETRVEEVEFLGNTAGYGALYALLDTEARKTAAAIVEEAEYVELAALDGFHDAFLEALFIPHRDIDRYPSVERRILETRGEIEEV